MYTSQVDPKDVWLQGEDNKSFCPDSKGHFYLHEAGLPFRAELNVEGGSVASTPVHSTTSCISLAVPTSCSSKDEQALFRKKQRCSTNEHLLEFDELKKDVCAIKKAIQDIQSINSGSNFPIGLKRLIRETFQCKICHGVPISPPVIMSKCCKSIIGCESCVNTWFGGDDALQKHCPACHAERGYSETLMMKGLDNFLEGIKSLQADV